MVGPVEVRHANGVCRVHVASGARRIVPALLADRHPGRRPVVIADQVVRAMHDAPVPGDVPTFTFPNGERHKTRETWAALTDRMLEAGLGRDAVVVAFGGGVATDLAGFVAATYLRGVPWIAVPTTSLAMIDASIGGKTGVDTAHGKNLVGAFHPPTDVVSDPDYLETLPSDVRIDGFAEAVKHAVTLDLDYGRWIGEAAEAILLGKRDELARLVHRSAELKAEVVSGDEREGGRRAVLNAGHTIAHALEQVSGYALSHGRAVAIGLVLETRLAERMGIAEVGTADRVAVLLERMRLPVAVPHWLTVDPDACLAAMRVDKKNRDGAIHAALLATPGTIARRGEGWTHPLDLDLLRTLLA